MLSPVQVESAVLRTLLTQNTKTSEMIDVLNKCEETVDWLQGVAATIATTGTAQEIYSQVLAVFALGVLAGEEAVHVKPS
jgi:hypothetical protein